MHGSSTRDHLTSWNSLATQPLRWGSASSPRLMSTNRQRTTCMPGLRSRRSTHHPPDLHVSKEVELGGTRLPDEARVELASRQVIEEGLHEALFPEGLRLLTSGYDPSSAYFRAMAATAHWSTRIGPSSTSLPPPGWRMPGHVPNREDPKQLRPSRCKGADPGTVPCRKASGRQTFSGRRRRSKGRLPLRSNQAVLRITGPISRRPTVSGRPRAGRSLSRPLFARCGVRHSLVVRSGGLPLPAAGLGAHSLVRACIALHAAPARCHIGKVKATLSPPHRQHEHRARRANHEFLTATALRPIPVGPQVQRTPCADRCRGRQQRLRHAAQNPHFDGSSDSAVERIGWL